MKVILFDSILEEHVCESFVRAFRDRGHDVLWTGPIWKGHRFPYKKNDIATIESYLESALETKPDLFFNFRASNLTPTMLEMIKSRSIRSAVWLPDDPVLYQTCYQEVVDSYDLVLHCGGDAVLKFYEAKHPGLRGVNFPFWTDNIAFPKCYDPERAHFDGVFLGSTKGPVRHERYEILRGLGQRILVLGRTDESQKGLYSTFVKDGYKNTVKIVNGIASAKVGLNIPQFFSAYKSSKYDFDGLSQLGSFQFPSRVVQYAAIGMPVLTLGQSADPAFPEFQSEMSIAHSAVKFQELSRNIALLQRTSDAVSRRFNTCFSALSRVLMVESLMQNWKVWEKMDVQNRQKLFTKSFKSSSSNNFLPRDFSGLDLPTVEEQRRSVRERKYTAKRRWRILHLGTSVNGETDIISCMLRGLNGVGHDVLNLDVRQHKYLIENPPRYWSGFGPIFINSKNLLNTIDAFRPQIIICDAGGLCFDNPDLLKDRGILLLGVTLSDPDVQPSMIDHVGQFDFHTTNARIALERYKQNKIVNTSLFRFAIDQAYMSVDLPVSEEYRANVICIGHAAGRPERYEALGKIATTVEGVRGYGSGWGLPGSKKVAGVHQIMAARGGLIHVNFPGTRAGFTNVKCGVFESIGSGGVIFTHKFDEMAEFFRYDDEICSYTNTEDLLFKIRSLLADPVEVERIRRNAFYRLSEEHLYEHRWNELFDRILNEIENPTFLDASRAQILSKTLSEEAKAKQRVIVSGFYGSDNTGDEFILRSLSQNLAEDSEIQIVVASQSAPSVARDHGLLAFKRTDLDAATSQVSASKAVLLGGGGLWHDYTFQRSGRMTGLFTANSASISGFAKVPMLAKMYGKEFHVVGLGVGPIRDPESKQMTKFVAQLADSIYVRDEESRAYLESIPCWNAEVNVYPDLVYALRLDEPVEVEEIKLLRDQGYEIVGINLREWSEAERRGIDQKLVRCLSKFCIDKKIAIVMVPMQLAADKSVIERFMDTASGIGCPIVVVKPNDNESRFRQIYSALSQVDILIAMRLHACLLAHRSGIPVLGLSYDPKVKHHFSELNLSSNCFDLDFDTETLRGAIERIWDSRIGFLSEIEEKLQSNRLRVENYLKELKSRLCALPDVNNPIIKEWETLWRLRASHQVLEVEKPDAESLRTNLDLRTGSISYSETSGQTGNKKSIWRSKTLLHFAEDAPKVGARVDFDIPVELQATGRGCELSLSIFNSYFRPKNAGKIAYQLLIDGRLILEEDIALWGNLNRIFVYFVRDRPRIEVKVRLLAKKNCKPWSWDRVSETIVSDVSLSSAVHEGAMVVRCSSPKSSIFTLPAEDTVT